MRLRWLGVVAASLVLAAVNAAAAPILSIDPVTGSVGAGGTSTFNIKIAGAVDLYAYEFDVGFTSGVISANSITEGPFLATGGSTFFVPGTINNGAGTISFTANSLLTAISGVSGTGILATVNFTGLAAGTANLTLFNVSLLDSSLSNQTFTTQGGSVTVTGSTPPAQTPEPASLALLATGLAALGVRRRRTR